MCQNTNRQNIRMPQREHQEHARRPDANAFDLGQMLDRFFFRPGAPLLTLFEKWPASVTAG
jgi:hypothetical protein